MMADSQTAGLERAHDVTARLIAGVGPDQWGLPSPCEEWTVRDLVSHLVVGNRRFLDALRGSAPDSGQQGDPPLPAELSGAYRESADLLTETFAEPGVLQRMVTVPFGTVPGMVALHLRTTETLVHGWDLARATAQPMSFPEDVVQQELSFSRDMVGNIPPDRSPFGPPQIVADEAPAIDQLAALLGRTVQARPQPAGA